MAIFYHGTQKLFDRFDLSHALEGDGKVKFGFGVYVTQRYATAAHYSVGRDKVVNPEKRNYVYTLDVPEKTDDNYLRSGEAVNHKIISSRTWNEDESQTFGEYDRCQGRLGEDSCGCTQICPHSQV